MQKKILKKIYQLYRIGMIAMWWEAINGPKPKENEGKTSKDR